MPTKKIGDKHRETKRKHIEHEVEASAGGAIAGGAIGAFAGPPGAVVGAILGAAAGALADYDVEHDSVSRAEDRETRAREPGMSEVEPNAPKRVHRTAKLGTYAGPVVDANADDGDDDVTTKGPVPTLRS